MALGQSAHLSLTHLHRGQFESSHRPSPNGFSVTRKTALAVSGSSPPFFRLSPFLENVKAARNPPSRLNFPDFLKVGSLIA
jgi:hypothetical protein